MYEMSVRLPEMREHGNVLTRLYENRSDADLVASAIVGLGLAPDVTVCERNTYRNAVSWQQDADGIARPQRREIKVVYP